MESVKLPEEKSAAKTLRAAIDLDMITNRSLVQTNQVNFKRARVQTRGKGNLLLPTYAMKSPPLNASSAPLLVPRDMDTAGQLSVLYSHVTTLNGQYRLYPYQTFLMLTENAHGPEQVTELKEQLSTIISHVVCLKGESCCETYSVTENHIRMPTCDP